MDVALTAEDNREFLAAFKECADRGIGPPAQAFEHSGKDGGAIQVEQVWIFGGNQVKF